MLSCLFLLCVVFVDLYFLLLLLSLFCFVFVCVYLLFLLLFFVLFLFCFVCLFVLVCYFGGCGVCGWVGDGGEMRR